MYIREWWAIRTYLNWSTMERARKCGKLMNRKLWFLHESIFCFYSYNVSNDGIWWWKWLRFYVSIFFPFLHLSLISFNSPRQIVKTHKFAKPGGKNNSYNFVLKLLEGWFFFAFLPGVVVNGKMLFCVFSLNGSLEIAASYLNLLLICHRKDIRKYINHRTCVLSLSPVITDVFNIVVIFPYSAHKFTHRQLAKTW